MMQLNRKPMANNAKRQPKKARAFIEIDLSNGGSQLPDAHRAFGNKRNFNRPPNFICINFQFRGKNMAVAITLSNPSNVEMKCKISPTSAHPNKHTDEHSADENADKK